MRWLVIILFVLFLGGLALAAPKPVSHTLGWDYAAPATSFVLEQCTNTRSGCPMQVAATLDGGLRRVDIGGLDRRQSYCWRMKAVRTGGGETPYSNIVCTS
jgi:hypothetical protein